MIHDLEPPRLIETVDVDETLRSDLVAASAPTVAYDVGAGAAQFDAALAAGAGTTAVPAVASSRLALGIGVIGGGALALVAGLWAAGVGPFGESQPAAVENARPQPVVVMTPALVPTAAEPTPAPAPQEPPAPAVAPETTPDPEPAIAPVDHAAAPKATKPKSSAKSVAKNAAKPGPDAFSQELALVDEARRALESNPAKTLELCERGDRDFPQGAMVQERRGLSVLALAGLGRSEQARSAGEKYLQRWPRGTFASRIRQTIGLDD